MTAVVVGGACLVCGQRGPRESVLDGLLHRCADCGFTWTVQSSAPPEELYDSAYFSGGGYDEYFRPGPRRFEAERRVRWLRSVTARRGLWPASLVEAGSAGGFFVAAARAAGIDAQGVEVSEAAARYAREQLGMPVQHGLFERAELAGPVQAVCAFHVLEHVSEPNEFLRAARRALTPGGLLAIEVPNVACPAATRFGLDWPGLQPRFHRWHFTPDSLLRLVTAHGFVPVRQDTAVFRYYLPVRYRLRQARHQVLQDIRHTGSVRLTHRHRGDLLRLVARRPEVRT
jgi:SAM-dependent methyltransferase